MTTRPADALALIDRIRFDLTAAQGKITDLKIMLGDLSAQVPKASEHVCPKCGVEKKTEERLNDHVELVHE